MSELIGWEQLGLDDRELISVVGAGGKTTTVFGLAEFLTKEVLITTTTKMSANRTGGYPLLIAPKPEQIIKQLGDSPGVVVFSGIANQRGLGFSTTQLNRWFSDRVSRYIVCEADGARRKLAKAPAEHEPVIPSLSTTVLVVIGAAALGQTIEVACHRPELVATLADCTAADVLTPLRASKFLRSDLGGKRRIPAMAKTALAINRINTKTEGMAQELGELCRGSFDQVVMVPEHDHPVIEN